MRRGLRWVASMIVVMAGLVGDARAGAKVWVTEDQFIAFDVLLQPQFNFGFDSPGPSGTFRFAPHLRRARFLFSGQITPCIQFFFQGEAPNFGLNADWTPRFFPLDAFAEFSVGSALQIDTGVLLLPFSHHGMQGAVSLLGVDFGGSTIIQPPNVNASNGTVFPSTLNVWRDVGVQLRGLFANDWVDYRLAVTGGIPKALGGSALNPLALPRVTGRVTVNFFEAEGGPGGAGYYYHGLHLDNDGERLLSPKTVLSVGGGASWQHDVVPQGSTLVDYTAYNVDVFWDIPFGDKQQAFNGQVNWFYYGATGAGNAYPAMAVFAEAGYRWHRVEPLAAVEWLAVQDSTGAGNVLYWRGGFNFWLVGHNGNVKIDAGARSDSNGPATFAARVQTQLMF